MFYLLLRTTTIRDRVLNSLRRAGIRAIFHYVPLHSSPAATAFGQPKLPITDHVSETMIRLPMFYDITNEEQDRIIRELGKELSDAP